MLIFLEDCQGKFILKTTFTFWQSSKKIERRIKANQPNWVAEFRDLGFFGWFIDKKNNHFFFQLKIKISKSNLAFFSTEKKTIFEKVIHVLTKNEAVARGQILSRRIQV